MFEVTARDAAARTARWELPSGSVTTPAVVHPATPRHEPPERAELVLSRDDPGRRPWLRDAGTAFSPAEPDGPDGADAVVPPALSYPPSVDASVHEEARSQHGSGGPVQVVSPKAPAAGPDAECMVAPGIAPLLGRPRRLAEALVALRAPTYQAALFLPGVGRPADVALLSYVGVDLFDATPCLAAARDGTFQSIEGSRPATEEARASCPCPACLGDAEGYGWLREHNLWAQRAEVARVREAIADGGLRELVESRARSRPWAVALLRHLDRRHAGFLEERSPVHRDRPLLATSREALDRPEVARYRRRLRARYDPPETADVLLLFPCSAHKPYAESRTHRRLRQALRGLENRWAVHEVVVTSPLGVVPRELERVHPAAHYDLPVSGDWSLEEAAMIRDGVADLLERGSYRHVVAHLHEEEADIVADAVPKMERTAVGDPRSGDSLASLRETLQSITAGLEKVGYDDRLMEELAAIARFQFGPGGEELVEGARAEGPWPKPVILDGDTQLAALVPTRGRYTLTLEGGRRLLDVVDHAVRIEDFTPEGDVFAVGVLDADDGVRVEDEVVVAHEGEVRAVGRAAMPGPEMVESDRGIAVEVNHRA